MYESELRTLNNIEKSLVPLKDASEEKKIKGEMLLRAYQKTLVDIQAKYPNLHTSVPLYEKITSIETLIAEIHQAITHIKQKQFEKRYQEFLNQSELYHLDLERIQNVFVSNSTATKEVQDAYADLLKMQKTLQGFLDNDSMLDELKLDKHPITMLSHQIQITCDRARSQFDYLTLSLSQKIKLLLRQRDKENQLQSVTSGPLDKTETTQNFESLIKAILAERTVVLHTDPQSGDFLEFKTGLDDPVFSKFYLKDLPQVNFEHIRLNEAEIAIYEEFIENKHQIIAGYSPKYTPNSSLSNGLPQLQQGEKIAIKVYTHLAYIPMNQLLKGTLDVKECGENKLKEILLHVAVLSQGLAHFHQELPSQTPDFVVRKTKMEQVDKLLGLQPLNQERALSSSYNTETAADMPVESQNDINLIVANPGGLDISSISEYPEENEWLIPPGQLFFLGALNGEEGLAYVFQFLRTPGIFNALISTQQPQTDSSLDGEEEESTKLVPK